MRLRRIPRRFSPLREFARAFAISFIVVFVLVKVIEWWAP